MRSTIVAFSMTLVLMVSAAQAQVPQGPRPTGGVPSLIPPPSSSPAALPGTGPAAAPASAPAVPPAPDDTPRTPTYTAGGALPAPTPPDQLRPATIAMPTEAIEPYLLTRDNGPFMVLAKTFRGPDCEKLALALALELRREYHLPAYVLRTKDFPMRSMIRNVPPTAPGYVRKSQLTDPEKVRTYDEAAVLVGNEKTLAASEALLHKVRKISPKCLRDIPSPYPWRSGLATALRTTNPYVPTQDIFPGKKRDDLVQRMNSGPRSIFQCPGRYTLQVAEFGGRAVYNPTKEQLKGGDSWLKGSPLATAHDDAEQLADRLMRDKDVQKTGAQVYVYHDRTTSRVTIGAFQAPNDPSAVALRDSLLRCAVPMADKSRVGQMIVPANALTDLDDPQNPIRQR